VILAVALALGLGTMVGWKRVVLTIGEKIGKQGMTYAQGMSAQITTASLIGLANIFSLPVSTTHVCLQVWPAPWSPTKAACKAALSEPSCWPGF
jgi:phosphate/sulfate permease